MNNGMTPTGDTRTFTSYNQPSLNVDRLVVFRGRVKGGGGEPTHGILVRDVAEKSVVTTIFDHTTRVPQPNNTDATFIAPPSLPRIDTCDWEGHRAGGVLERRRLAPRRVREGEVVVPLVELLAGRFLGADEVHDEEQAREAAERHPVEPPRNRAIRCSLPATVDGPPAGRDSLPPRSRLD